MTLRWSVDHHCFEYEFWVAGRRFNGLTHRADKEEAWQVKRQRREDAIRRELEGCLLGEGETGSLLDVWVAVTEVVGSAYDVAAETLRSQSRGRGPRPPRATWEARKMAVHLTVVVSGHDAATVGRLVGLHKDTASSHCIWAREACADSDEIERLSLVLEYMARLRLKLSAFKGKTLRSAA